MMLLHSRPPVDVPYSPLDSPVPSIEISFAPPEDPVPEPYSPFTPLTPVTPNDDDASRPYHLSPPPQPHMHPLSPLRPASSCSKGQGLERERFDALLKASRERNALAGAKKSADLRKEVALKAHRSKQAERRALFLSKVEAPPSPSAISMPKTPPDSPAVFHYSLPSPGLMSPLALFESLGYDDPTSDVSLGHRQTWVEQVDFRLPKKTRIEKPAKPTPMAFTVLPASPATPTDRQRAKSPPSLEQISARLGPHGRGQAPHARRSPIPLPAFLQTYRPSSPPEECQCPPAEEKARPTFSSVGRLRLPVRPAPRCPLPPCPAAAAPLPVVAPTPRAYMPPSSPLSPPMLQITTTVIPRTSSTSPVQLTEANLHALNSRSRTAQDMLSALRRRTVVHGRAASIDVDAIRDAPGAAAAAAAAYVRKGRRISAPPELPRRPREGFHHPVLKLPGGF